MTPMQHLLSLITVAPQGENQFLGAHHDIGLKQTFGGQLIGQAINAASQTVSEDRFLHAINSQFILPGDSSQPIDYHVTPLRDGKSFSLRQVTAIQNDTPIFYLTASFQLAETGLDFHNTMPDVPDYQDLVPDHIQAQDYVDVLPPKLADLLTKAQAFEVRSTQYSPPFLCKNCTPTKYLWFRGLGDLPQHLAIQQALLAYFSDFHLIPTALQPHGLSFFEPNLQIASLNHSMWFHRDFNLEEWHFFAVEVTNTSGNRGLVKGEFYTQSGQLIATCVQEGVIRKTTDES